MIVLTESKQDFTSMDPARLLEHHVANLEKGMSAPVRVPLSTTALGAYPARQMELHGGVNNVKIAYLVTAVEGPNYFHGIIAWTTKSRWAESKPLFDKTLPSFREL